MSNFGMAVIIFAYQCSKVYEATAMLINAYYCLACFCFCSPWNTVKTYSDCIVAVCDWSINNNCMYGFDCWSSSSISLSNGWACILLTCQDSGRNRRWWCTCGFKISMLIFLWVRMQDSATVSIFFLLSFKKPVFSSKFCILLNQNFNFLLDRKFHGSSKAPSKKRLVSMSFRIQYKETTLPTQ